VDAAASGPSHREGIENIVGEILYGSKWMVGRNHLLRRGVDENGSLSFLASLHAPLKMLVDMINGCRKQQTGADWGTFSTAC